MPRRELNHDNRSGAGGSSETHTKRKVTEMTEYVYKLQRKRGRKGMIAFTVAVCLFIIAIILVIVSLRPRNKASVPRSGDIFVGSGMCGRVARRLQKPQRPQQQALDEISKLQNELDYFVDGNTSGIIFNGNVSSPGRASVPSALPFLLPPEVYRAKLMNKVNTILNFGTRVAGSFSPGHLKTLDYLTSEGQWHPPRDGLFTPSALAATPLPASYWELEWDNFTNHTPFGTRRFFNLAFHFSGGSAFKKQNNNNNNDNGNVGKGKQSRSQLPSFAATDKKKLGGRKLGHVILSAHWDSKYFAHIEFLGACDSVVPVVFLLETMQLITVLSDTAAIVKAGMSTGANDREVCLQMSKSLSPMYLSFLRYYYADDEDTLRCLSIHSETGGGSKRESRPLFQSGANWLRLLDLVANLPAITVIFFDGEEAFVRWNDTDSTYGSRHLAQKWKKTSAPSAPPGALFWSRFDSIDLFVLYDLMGTARTQFHNYFPDQSGLAFALLADVEHAHRRRAEELRYILDNSSQTPASSARTSVSKCPKEMPELWCRLGSPHGMFTAQGGASTQSPRTTESDDNIFFPLWETSAQGPRLTKGFNIQDDHIHWMDTQRMLHVIPSPFPSSWHNVRDDGSDLDNGTIVDLFRILSQFTLCLGEGWMDNTN